MKSKNTLKKIIILILTIFIIGLFLIGLVSVDKFVETLSSKEQYYLTSYSYIISFFEQLDGYEFDDETSDLLLNQFVSVIDEINQTLDYKDISVSILDKSTGLIETNDKTSDAFMKTLPLTLNSDSRKIKGSFDYYNIEYYNYRILLKIDCGGFFNVAKENGLFKDLGINSLLFIVLTVLLLLFNKAIHSPKGRKTIGLIFILIWIGQLAITSALSLYNHHNQVIEDEKEHITSLTCFYYKEDIIEHNDEILDRKEFAESIIDGFTKYNENIKSYTLNDNYDIDDLDLSDCLDFVIDDNRDLLYQRIDKRVDLMIEQGLIDEVKHLYEQGLRQGMTSAEGIGYKQLLPFFD